MEKKEFSQDHSAREKQNLNLNIDCIYTKLMVFTA